MQFHKLKIDGAEYTLAYDYNKICEVEELTGINLLAALENLRSLSAGQLRGLFLAALEAGPEQAFPGKTPEQSLEMAGDLIRLDTLTPITEALAAAYNLSIPEPSGPSE